MWLQVIYLNINENKRIAEVEGVSWGLYQADEKFDSVILGKSDYYEVDGLFSSSCVNRISNANIAYDFLMIVPHDSSTTGRRIYYRWQVLAEIVQLKSAIGHVS